MRAFLDDQPLVPDPPSAPEALRAASQAAQRRGRIIVEIVMDGRPVDVEGVRGVADEVRLFTAEPRALVREALRDARGLLGELRAVQTAASDAFLMGEFDAGTAGLREVIGGWQRVRSAADQAGALLGTPLETVALDIGDGPRPMRNEIETLTAALAELRDAIARQDVAALADLLEYDLGALARRWERLLGAFAGPEPSGGTA